MFRWTSVVSSCTGLPAGRGRAPLGTLGAMAQKLILDVDTGMDDAVALMLAALHPDLELIGATTVNGNVPVDYCTENSLRTFDWIGVDVPVYEGVTRPIARADFPIPRPDIQSTNAVHGGYLDVPPSHSKKQATGAVEFLVETYRAATEPIILVPVGPLSNIATALTMEPRLKDLIPELVIMGGAHHHGNVTPRAEFNVWADPRPPGWSSVAACEGSPWSRSMRPTVRSSRSTTAPSCARSARPPARRRPASRSAGSTATTRLSRWRGRTRRRSTTPWRWPRSSIGPSSRRSVSTSTSRRRGADGRGDGRGHERPQPPRAQRGHRAGRG